MSYIDKAFSKGQLFLKKMSDLTILLNVNCLGILLYIHPVTPKLCGSRARVTMFWRTFLQPANRLGVRMEIWQRIVSSQGTVGGGGDSFITRQSVWLHSYRLYLTVR